MNILIIGPMFPWRGGIAHHSASLAEHLKTRHRVEAVTFSRQYPKLFFPGTSQYDTGGHPPSIPVHQWIDSINPFTWLRTASRIRKLKPDLLIFAYSIPFFGPAYGVIAALTRWKTKTKTLFFCHNVLPHEKRIGDTFFAKFAFAFADFFFLQSHTLEQDLRLLQPTAKFAVAPHPLHETIGKAIPTMEARKLLGISAKRVILFFGYVRKYKGLMTLLDAMTTINKNLNGDILLLVAGEFYESIATYQQKVHELGLEQHIRFHAQYVPHDEVPLFFSAADVVVLPYRSATQSGIVPMAYNFDKPVIATKVGGLAEVVIDGKTGFLVPPNDPAALANAVSRFYSEQREQEFIANVKIEKQKYTWEALVEKIETLVHQ